MNIMNIEYFKIQSDASSFFLFPSLAHYRGRFRSEQISNIEIFLLFFKCNKSERFAMTSNLE